MRDIRQFFLIHLGPQRNILERVEIFHRHFQFFREKAGRITHHRTAAGQVKFFRLAPFLLRAVNIDRTTDLAVQTRHHITDDLGNGGRHLGIRFLVSSAQRHKSMTPLHFLGFLVGNSKFLADLERDGMTGDRDDSDEKTPAVHEKQRGTAVSDIQDQLAIRIPYPVQAGRIVACRRRNFHKFDLLAERFDQRGNLLDLIAFDDHEHGFNLTAVIRRFQQLGIPYDLTHIIRDSALGLEFDDLTDLLFIGNNGRHFDKPDIGIVSGQGKTDFFGIEFIRRQNLVERFQHIDPGIGFHEILKGTVRSRKFFERKTLHQHFAIRSIGKLRSFDTAGSDIYAQHIIN